MQFAGARRGWEWRPRQIKSKRADLKLVATEPVRRIAFVPRQQGAGLRPAPTEKAALDGCAGRAEMRRENPASGGKAAAGCDNFSGVSFQLRNFVTIGVTISVTPSAALGDGARTSRR